MQNFYGLNLLVSEIQCLLPKNTISSGTMFNMIRDIYVQAQSPVSIDLICNFLYQRISLGDEWAKALDKAKYVFEAQNETQF